MNTNKQSFNWLIDAALFLGFLAAFFVNLTGVDLHQWLGLGLGAFAGYHLLCHWDWVRSVTAKFFSSTQPRVLAYYTIDAALLIGFFLIIATGVAISNWLSLAAGAYAVWKNLHVYASVISLALVLLKIGLHWRWIIKTSARLIAATAPTPVLAGARVPAAQTVSRRHFLSLMSVVGLASWAAVSNVVTDQPTVQAEALTTTTSAAAASSGSSAQVTTGASSSASPSSSSGCVLLCNKHCSYPGRCRRYVDVKGNGKCDLSECV